MEYLAIDTQGFSTDSERALEQLFAEQSDKSQDYKVCIDTMACPLANCFCIYEVRFSSPKSAKDTTMPTTFCELVSTKLAAELLDRLVKYKSTIPNYP